MSPPVENQWVEGEVKLSLYGEPVEIKMTVPAGPVPLTRMLPVFQQATHTFLDIAEQKVKYEGKKISCSKGCDACCYQLIPLSENEVLYFSELVEGLPEPQRTDIKHKFDAAFDHFVKIGWFEKFNRRDEMSEAELYDLHDEYLNERIPCPFLQNSSCSIHKDRPIICREYLVTSPAENCADPKPDTINRVKMLFSILDTVIALENDNREELYNYVPLIAALSMTKQGAPRSIERTGPEWMQKFFTYLGKK